MEASKSRVVIDYSKLGDELVEQIKLVYPYGFSQHLITFTNAQGLNVSALRFETFEKIYLIRMTTQLAEKIIDEDTDYDDDGNLKDDIKEQYEEEHADIEYLGENDNYEEDED